MRKTAIVLLALPVLAAGSYFGLTAYANHEAQRQVDAVFRGMATGGIEARHGGVSFDIFTARLEVADIAFVYPGDRGATRIGRIRASGLGEAGGDRVKAERIEISDLAFEGRSGPGMTAAFLAPTITIDRYDGPIEVKARTGQPWQIALAFLRQASIARIDVPAAKLTTALAEGTMTTSTEIAYGATSLESIAGAVIQRVSMAPSNVTLHTSQGDGNGHIGAISGEGIDVGAWINAVTDEPVAAGEIGTLARRYGIDGYEFAVGDKIRLKGGPVTLTELAIAAPGIPVAEITAAEQEIQAREQRGETVEPADLDTLLTLLASGFDALRLGSFEAGAIEMATPDAAKARIATLHAAGLTDGVLGEARLEGFAGTDPAGRPAKLDRVAVTGLRIGDLMRQAAANLSQDDHAGSGPAPRLDMVQGFELLGLVAPSDTGDGPYQIDSLTFSTDSFVNQIPRKATGSVRMAVPTATFVDQQLFALLAANGVARVTISGDIASNWDETSGVAVVAPIALDISNVGSIAGQLRIGNVRPDSFSGDSTIALAAGRLETLESASFTLRDAGLYDMKLKQLAEEQGASPKAVRQLLTGVAAFIVNQFAGDRPALEPAGRALISFLDGPGGTLTLNVRPRSTLTFGAIMDAAHGDPLDLLDKVDIEANASR
ncbi:hypothetical protein [Ancylobacter lacus]|uniref:hypothetical protein n=1 Tax=Ancylobacter lacus TaxID=2579970 RepID=UPI001BD0415D|nr:hypothetical protein [Ancylobacter lacus]MBS7540222.1 hypothetical protein [Ancylobacter lacus]